MGVTSRLLFALFLKFVLLCSTHWKPRLTFYRTVLLSHALAGLLTNRPAHIEGRTLNFYESTSTNKLQQAACFSSDEERVYGCYDNDASIVCWDTRTATTISSIRNPEPVWCLAHSPQAAVLAAAGLVNGVAFWGVPHADAELTTPTVAGGGESETASATPAVVTPDTAAAGALAGVSAAAVDTTAAPDGTDALAACKAFLDQTAGAAAKTD